MFKLKLFVLLNIIVLVVHAISKFPNAINGECGFSKLSKKRIIGGSSAGNGEFPWIALIGYGPMSENKFGCDGSIITKKHVLTAAHCILPGLSYVRLGEHDRNTDTDGQHQNIPVSWIYKHREYADQIFTNDIALLWLERTIQYNDRIQPICLPSNDMTNSAFIHKSVTLAGWGRKIRGDPNVVNQLMPPSQQSPSVLKKVNFKVEDPTVCARSFQINPAKQICVADKTYGQGGCQGDSGGPLMTKKGGNKQYFLIGIVSYGPLTCNSMEKPNVYTSVLAYIPWIKSAMEQFARYDQ